MTLELSFGRRSSPNGAVGLHITSGPTYLGLVRCAEDAGNGDECEDGPAGLLEEKEGMELKSGSRTHREETVINTGSPPASRINE